METLTQLEIQEVSGGLSIEDGGAGVLGAAATAAMAGAWFATGFGLVIGIGLLWYAYDQY